MGVSAARMLGALPRALATAVVAVPRQHRPIALTDRAAQVRFVRRDTDAPDAERAETPLGPVLVTTPEQTVLDLARRPELGNAEREILPAIKTLYRRSDPARLEQLAREQHRIATLREVEGWVRYGPTNRLPARQLFDRAPDERDWNAQLAGQTRLQISAETALSSVRDAWAHITNIQI